MEKLNQSELRRSQALWAANGARSYSFEFTALDDWPGRVQPDWELAKTHKISESDREVVFIIDLNTGPWAFSETVSAIGVRFSSAVDTAPGIQTALKQFCAALDLVLRTFSTSREETTTA